MSNTLRPCGYIFNLENPAIYVKSDIPQIIFENLYIFANCFSDRLNLKQLGRKMTRLPLGPLSVICLNEGDDV